MTMRLAVVLVMQLSAVPWLAGCASVSATRVKPGDYETSGVRYFLAAPYLLVTAPVELKREETLERLIPAQNQLAEPTSAQQLSHDLPKPAKEKPNSEVSPTDLASTDPPLDATRSLTKQPIRASYTTIGGNAKNPRDSAKAQKISDHKDPTPTPAGGGSSSDARKKAGATEGDKAKTEPASGSGGPDTSTASPKSPGGGTQDNAVSPSTAVGVVWLPDYCQQYALHQKNVLSSSKFTVQLGDGWKLGQYTLEADTTAIATKILDLLGATVTAGKDIAVEKIKAKAGAEAKQAGGITFLLHTTITYLQPGLYQIFKYSVHSNPENHQASPSENPCSSIPTFSLDSFTGGIQESHTWRELPFSPDK
jgi:hypothetical protein